MNLMFNPWRYESKYKKFKFWELASIPVILASLFGLCYLASIHRDKIDKKDDAIGRQKYSQLLKLADVDCNGSLSDTERKLLCSRIDQNLDQYTSPSARPYEVWSYCMANPPLLFGGKVRNRIEKAIEMYESDIRAKNQ